MKKLLMIVNPNAGKAQIKGQLTDILDSFIKAGYQVEVYITQKAGDATRIAAKRGPKMDRIVCSGGDGTLDETVNGLMQIPEEKRPELGYISAGTTNDYAHSMKLPDKMVEAAGVAANGIPISVDLGNANGQYFCYVYGFGAFTDVSYVTPQEMKKVLGHQAYILEGARQVFNIKPYHMKIEANGKIYEDDYICGLISNSERIGGVAGLWGKDIHMDDGLFEVTLLRMPPHVMGWGDLAAAFVTNNDQSEYLIQFKTDHLLFTSPEPINWVQDGEFGGEYDQVEIQCLHNVYQLIVPAEKAEEQKN